MAIKLNIKAKAKTPRTVDKLRNNLKYKTQAAKVKSQINDLKHKQKVQKLERQKITNDLKAQKQLAKPKQVAKRADREFALKRLEARREVDVINAKNKWKNTLAAGVTASTNIDALKNQDGKSIQEEIEKALAGPSKESVKV